MTRLELNRLCNATTCAALWTFHEEDIAVPILHVRNVPDELYVRIQQLANAKNRSLSAQVISLR